MRKIFIGYDSREGIAYDVAATSIARRLTAKIPIFPLVLKNLQDQGIYTRKTVMADGRLFDIASGHPMSTEFAISRFFVPYLAETGWAAFLDSDVLARADLIEMFNQADPKYAVMCVQHDYRPAFGYKKVGQVQEAYDRKNWSSVALFNCDHPANKRLTLEMLNTLPGRDLHAFCWLKNEEIGALGEEWNFLVGHTSLDVQPKIVHFTSGGPWEDRYHDVPFADAWREELRIFQGVV